MGRGVNAKPRTLYLREDSVPIVQEAGWSKGAERTGAENLATNRDYPRTVQPVASRYSDWAIPA
jgi:hypothetical protein